MYSGGPPDEPTIIKLGKDLISATNRFGLEGFKMVMETTLVANRVINHSNSSDYLLLADSNCCALLKEYAIHFIAIRSIVVEDFNV